jgi:hypothetical protein
LLNINTMRKLASFIALSLLAHLMVLYGVRLELPQRVAEPLPLEVRLQPTAPPPPVLLRPRPHPHAAPRPAPPPVVPTPILTAPPQIAAAPVFDPAPPAISEPVVVESPPVAPPAAESSKPQPKPAPVPARRLPRRGEITYVLYLGSDKFDVGRTQQTWVIDNDRYRLTSISQTTGLAALFIRQRFDYVSSGRLTPSGLRPEFFGTERQRSGKTEAVTAKFDWNALTMTFGEPPRSATLPTDAQDIVSFMYQLGLMPLAPGRIELPITNGWKLERYELDVGGEEQLQTPFGTLRAVPVKQMRRPGQESIELWLAPEYRWLPVRIRFFDREGEFSGEQLVSEIRVSEDQ